MGRGMIAFIVLENLVLLFIIIDKLASWGAKREMVDYQIVDMSIPDKDGNVRIHVKRPYYAKSFDLYVSSVRMKSGNYKLGEYLSLPE